MIEVWAKFQGEPVFISAHPDIYVAQLKELVKEKLALNLNLPDFYLTLNGKGLEVGVKVRQLEQSTSKNPLCVIKRLGDQVESINPVLATIHQLNNICIAEKVMGLDDKNLIIYKRSCAGEIGRRLYHALAVRSINGIASLSLPTLSLETMELMKQEGYDVSSFIVGPISETELEIDQGMVEKT